MCRDPQTEVFDWFETYTPVAQWSTIRLALTIIISNNFHNRQLYYTNAFSQEYLKEEFYRYPHPGFGGYGGVSKVLRLIKILFGVRQEPKTFFDKLQAGILECVFIQSKLYPCLFIKSSIICLFMWAMLFLLVPTNRPFDL